MELKQTNRGVTSMSNKWRVEIGFYSLGVNRVGQPLVEFPPIVREHDNAISAMLDLETAIKKSEGGYHTDSQGESVAPTYQVISPDNCHLSLVAAYKEVFNVEPINKFNQLIRFPLLDKERKSRERKE
jgi:hypothetical protein